MRCILGGSNDPFFNLAAEEYLLKQFSDGFYFQYVNNPCVVVGKHQNALAEIDLDYLEEEGILLARRISGGGAVYHDPGNMNYAFITNESPGDFIRFRKYTAPVISALQQLGIPAHLGNRNELLTGERKISGTASHVFKTRVLHHGTLLYDADLDRLSKCLYVDAGRYRDKAVKSVRSEVVNLREIMESPLPAQDFFRHVFESILSSGEDHELYELSAIDMDAIRVLAGEKFSTWEWIYGYSPKYEVERKVETGGKVLQTRVSVNKGRIGEVVLSGTLIADTSKITDALKGARHSKREVASILSRLDPDPELMDVCMKGLF